MLDILLPILLFSALLLTVIGAVRRFSLWRQGRSAPVDWVGGLLKMPRRYLVDLHHIVDRDKYISKTHVATAGGFVLAALLAIIVHGFGLHSRILGWALLAATACMFTGALFVAKRRIDPPARLSKGPWMRLPKSLLAFAASFFIVTLPVAGVLPADFGGWILAAILAVGVAWGVSEMGHDLGRAHQARLRRCPASGLASSPRAFQHPAQRQCRALQRPQGPEA